MHGGKFLILKKILKVVLGAYLYDFLRHVIAHKRIPRPLKPVTFNDKILHRKFHDRNPDYLLVADKLLVRDYVAEHINEDILTTLYFYGDNAFDINFDILPEAFVIKATHGSGPDFIEFIRDKQQFGKTKLWQVAQELLDKEYGNITNEWWYTEVAPQIIIEEMLQDDEYGIPVDYKFFVMHGVVKFVQVDYSRFVDHTRTFYDRDWFPQEFTLKYRMGPVTPRPKRLSEMISIAESLGKGFDFVRIDLYCVNNERVVFGEMTLAPEAGWGRFKPAKWDRVLGAMW
ncbi:MAG TPA: hypothetical protein ENN32_00765 [Chloroflexi bacterium]|nr:hypothetical protein [Chloroflexota bacterium]